MKITLEHLTDMRAAINQVKVACWIVTFGFTFDPTSEHYVTTIKAYHIRHLRTALEQQLVAAIALR